MEEAIGNSPGLDLWRGWSGDPESRFVEWVVRPR